MGFAITSLLLTTGSLVLITLRVMGMYDQHGKKLDLFTIFLLTIVIIFIIISWSVMVGIHTKQDIREDSDLGPPHIRWAWILMFISMYFPSSHHVNLYTYTIYSFQQLHFCMLSVRLWCSRGCARRTTTWAQALCHMTSLRSVSYSHEELYIFIIFSVVLI